MERVVAGLQQRRVVSEKEKRILAFHEAGHALMAHLMGDVLPVQKVTIVGRGDALGYAYYLPLEERYLHTKEELLDVMKVALAGRAAEELVFGRVTNGASNDLEEGDGDRPLDGVRVRHVGRRAVTDDARRQLRCRRRRSGCATASRRGSPTTPTRSAAAAREAPTHPGSPGAGAAREGRRSCATSCSRCSPSWGLESRAAETVGTIRVLPAANE